MVLVLGCGGSGSECPGKCYQDVQVSGQGFGMFASVGFADLDGDGQTDFLFGTTAALLVNSGDPVAVGDFDGDGRTDFVTWPESAGGSGLLFALNAPTGIVEAHTQLE